MVKLIPIIQTIKSHRSFLISTHVSPDPDAICSELALAAYLRSLGKKVTIVNSAPVPERFLFFPGARAIRSYHSKMRVSFDAAIIVDCGELDRIGKVQQMLSGAKIINIDHHITNDSFGYVNFVDAKASSTCEMLYELLLQGKCVLNRSIALNLYAGIMTDTGSFRYDNTSVRTLNVAARLMEFKFSISDLYAKLYESIPLADIRNFTNIVSRFESYKKGQLLCLDLTKAVVGKFSEDFDLRDAVFKLLRSVKESKVFVIFSEVDSKKTRINFRSSGAVDVAKLASLFNGGGHKNASGCMINKGIKEARQIVIKEIGKYL